MNKAVVHLKHRPRSATKRLLSFCRWLPLILFFCLGVSANAYADVNPNNTLDSIVDLYRQHASAWESSLRNAATTLFWSLAVIDFTWTGIKLLLKQGDFSDWLAEFTNQIFFIGFFYALLLHSSEWARDIIQSFMQAASTASMAGGGGGTITPSNVFGVGLALAHQVMQQLSFMSPVESTGLIISALVIVVCFALIAAHLVMALVEAYVVMSAGVLLMGFGGSRWTQDYAMKMITYTLSVGAKLFVLELLIGLGQSMIEGWVTNFDAKDQSIFVMVGAAIVMLALTKSIPELVQGLISGSSTTHGGNLMGAASSVASFAAKTAGGVAAGVAGAGMAAFAANKLASTQIASAVAKGTPAPGRAGLMAKNLGSAALGDIGNRLSGQAHHGVAGGRMAGSIGQRSAELRSDMQKPQDIAVSHTPASVSSSHENTIHV